MHGSPVRNISLGEKMEIKTVLLPEVEGIEDYQGYCKNLYYTDGVRTIMRNRGIFDASEAVAGALESDRFSYDSVFAFFVPLMTQVIDELLDMKLSGNVTLCDVLTEAYKQHYAGDEQYSPETAAAISQVKNGRAVAQALDIVFRALGDSISNGGFSGLRAALRAPFVNVLLFPLSQVLGVVLGSFLEGIFIDGAPGDNNVVL